MQYIKAWTRGAIKIKSENTSQQWIALTGQSGEAPRDRTGPFTFWVFRSRPKQFALTGQSGDLKNKLTGAFVVSRVRAVKPTTLTG